MVCNFIYTIIINFSNNKKILDSRDKYKIIFIILGAYFLAFSMFLVTRIIPNLSNLMNYVIYEDLFVILMDQIHFCIGYLFARFDILKKLILY